MRCVTARVLSAYGATLDPRISNASTITTVSRPIKPRLIMQTLVAFYTRNMGLTCYRETRLLRVAQHNALIGGDREAAAGTRQATNGSRSSATSACFFGSLISDEAVCMNPMGVGVEAIHRVRRTDQQDTLQVLQYKQERSACLCFVSASSLFALLSLLHEVNTITMKNALIVSAITALAAAQSIADLPACSLTCLTSAIPSLGCGLTDFACSCKKADTLTPQLTPCVKSACKDEADQAKVMTVLSSICAAAGVPIEAPAPAASTIADPSPAPTSEPAEPTSEAPTETMPSISEEPGYSAYPTDIPPVSYPSTLPSASYPCMLILTPTAPSSSAEYEPIPSSVIVSRPSPRPTSVPGVLPPYPTSVSFPSGSPEPSIIAPTGTGVKPTTSTSLPPEFTGAAAAIKVPAVVAGVFGVAAFIL